LRLDDLNSDPRSVGFPPHHPPMRSLLALPVVSHGRVLGNLYLTEKEAEPTFNADDEETLGRFATLAALAIENARLHRQVRALAVTEERERIAREMHDSIAQVLGYVNTKAQAAQTLLENDQPERAAAHLSQLSEAAREAYADVREGILGLRTSLGEDRGFIETLQDYLDRWQGQSDVGVELHRSPPGYDPGLAPMSEVQLLRIIQEALSNVRKHARARRAWVKLRPAGAGVEVVIEDDGVGFDPDGLRRSDLPRFGMATMRERAEAVGGTFEITAVPDQGTRVSVHIPAEPKAAMRKETTVARADR
jgi:signal transduction histidine kinase